MAFPIITDLLLSGGSGSRGVLMEVMPFALSIYSETGKINLDDCCPMDLVDSGQSISYNLIFF